jgi:hypothetical protein
MGQMQRVGSRHTTVVRRADGVLRVTYHNTDVVTVHANGSITLDTGGWKSVTTKARMNQAANQYGLNFRVHQDDFAWFVTTFDANGKVLSQFCFDGNIVSFNPRTGRKERA